MPSMKLNMTAADREAVRKAIKRDTAWQRPHERTCVECDRVFDLTNDEDAEEWAYGHDCEDR